MVGRLPPFLLCIISLLLIVADGFVLPSPSTSICARCTSRRKGAIRPLSFSSAPPEEEIGEDAPVSQAEVEAMRLRALASQLRAEAASLEAEQLALRSKQVERTFRSFDTNKDGVIELSELKAGLELALRKTISKEMAQQLLDKLDVNKDGVLQPDELLTPQSLSMKLDEIIAEEKEAVRIARLEALEQEKVAKAEAKFLGMINDKEPNTADKILSTLPYVLPFLDAAVFGSYLLQGSTDNPLVILLILTLQLYRTVPFLQFGIFLGLSILSDNLSANKLVRHNARQAVYLDIALFPASILVAIAANANLPGKALEYGSDSIFVIMMLIISYSVGSSLLGVIPDKIPLISNLVTKRLDRFSFKDMEDKDDDDKGKRQ